MESSQTNRPDAPRSQDEAQPEPDLLLEDLKEFLRVHKDLSFKGNDGRDLAHDLVQYPAMMVPRMQGALIDAVSKSVRVARVVDPFMGSGTVMLEAVRRGLPFTGFDINPYAALISSVKSIHHDVANLRTSLAGLERTIKADTSRAFEVSFPGRDKWFHRSTAHKLGRIRRAVQALPDRDVRRFFWVCLGETVRLTSNSRTSTFKLHVRSPEDIANRQVRPIQTFLALGSRMLGLVAEEQQLFRRKQDGECSLFVQDIIKSNQRMTKADLLLSSPPYGDNTTTVPYGQFSYLPMQWLDHKDVPGCEASSLTSTHSLDTASLGGTRRGALASRSELEDRIPSLRHFLGELADRKQPMDRTQRVLAYTRDLDLALGKACSLLRSGGVMAWTVGNRRVGGVPLPLNRILREILQTQKCVHVIDLERRIPSKRMAIKNSISETMRTETIVVLRKL